MSIHEGLSCVLYYFIVIMAGLYSDISWSEACNLLRKWRENNERNSEDTIEIWESVLEEKMHKLGNDSNLSQIYFIYLRSLI